MNFKDILNRFTGPSMTLSNSRRVNKVALDLNLQTQALTRKDIASWRSAMQRAINIEEPNRRALYSIYSDILIDLHVSGCIDQRKGFTLKKSFKMVNPDGKENKQITAYLEDHWFTDLIDYVLDSKYWGHSLIELGDVVRPTVGTMRFDGVRVIPRAHVIPERGIILRDLSDSYSKGFSYRQPGLSDWCIEAGRSHDLGLLLKVAPQSIAKKNMLAYWDQFGELFGMPIRIAKTTSRDPNEHHKIVSSMDAMGTRASILLQDGTELDIKETSRGDAYNVYDKRIDRANSEISKAILNQTMTIEDGSSLSQASIHYDVFHNIVGSDADFVKDIINRSLIPLMLKHGFPIAGYRFDWDDTIDYTPEQQIEIDKLILTNYNVDLDYIIDKYNIPVTCLRTTPGIAPEDAKQKKEQKLAGFFD